MRPLLLAAAAALLAMGTPSAARANACTVGTPQGIAFGAYNPNATSNLLAAPATCTLSCTGRGTVTVNLSRGGSASYAPRQMRSGTNTLNYNIYWDNTYAAVWGDGTGNTTNGSWTSNGSTRNPDTATATYYGLIPARQDAAAGTYSDTVQIILIF